MQKPHIAGHRTLRIYGQPILALAAFWITLQSLVGGVRDGFPDFHIVYSNASAQTEAEVSSAGPNVHPPAVLLAFKPLTRFREPVAALVWTCAGLLALGMATRQASAEIPGTSAKWLLAVALGTQAGGLALRLGQISFLLAPLLTLAWIGHRTSRSWRLGISLGVLIYAKPFFGLYALYLLWRRQTTALMVVVGSFVIAASLGLWSEGIAGYRAWASALTNVDWQGNALNASAGGIAARMFSRRVVQPYPFYTPLLDSAAIEKASFGLFCGVLILGLVVCLRRRENLDQQWAAVGLTSILLSPLGWVYYLPILIGPIAGALMHNRRWVPACVAAVLLSAPYALLVSGHYGPFSTPLQGSTFFWGTLLLWIAVLLPPCRVEGEM